MPTKFTFGRKLIHVLTVAFLFCAVQTKAATLTASGSTTICPGDSVTLIASSGDSYQWFNFGFPIFGATSPTYVAKQTGQFTVVVTTALIPSTSNMVQVTISSFPTVTINSSTSNLCPGDGLSMIVNTSNNGGNAASFNALLNTNAIVTIPHHAQLIPAALTVEIWARPQPATSTAALISKLPASTSTQVGYAIKQVGNKFRFSIGREGNEQYVESSTFFLGPWYHLTCTYDGSTAKIYVNGILQGTASISSSINSTANITVGNVGSLTQSYKGFLDELRIWSTVKDPSTIQCNYRITTTPAATNLAGYWQMNEATSSGATPDATANQNHGVIANGAVLNSSSAGITNLIIWDVAPGIIDVNSPCVSLVPQATTTYKVTAINSYGCASTDSEIIVVYPPINEFAVTGGGIWCTGTPGLPIGLPGSQVGVSYQLKSGSVNIGSLVTGTGSAITLANITTGGLYTVEATANGCFKSMPGSATVTVKQSPEISGANVTNVTCNSGNNGSVDITVTSGTPAFSYAWSNSTTGQDATNLTADQYFVTVTDMNGCKDSDTFNITEPTALLLSSSITNVACFGQSNGGINLVTGGTPPLNFSWSNSATSQNLSGISAGTYAVNITDAVGCTDNETFTVTQPTALIVQKNVTQPGCFGGNNGSIDLTVTGGTLPYSYSWSNNATTEDISGLSAGSYTITINHSSCSYNETIVVGQPAQLSAVATPTNASCNGNSNGSVDLVVTGGTAPYTYSWSNSATSQDITNLTAGTYSVTVTDVNGCTATASAIVTQPAVVSVNGTASNVSCFGGADGGVSISTSGGTIPYTYTWSDNSTAEDLANAGAGAYSVIATDANGCSASANFTISQPTAVVASISNTTNALCSGSNTGAIDLSVTGGTAPYTYNWSNNATTQDLSNIPAGTYNVTVTDGNGCSATQSATVGQSGSLVATNLPSNVSCFGQSNGSIDITVTGGSTPYTYAWSNNATTQDVSGLAAGTYSVTITDANGCTASQSVAITQPTALAVTSNVTNATSGNNGSINITVAGGTAPYSYNWSNNTTAEDPTGLGAGTYSVIVTDANGCNTSANFTVIAVSTQITITGIVSPVLCFGDNSGAIDVTVTGGTAPYTYDWSFSNVTTEDRTNLYSGFYHLEVTDANNQTEDKWFYVAQPWPICAFGDKDNVTCNGGNDGSISLSVYGGTAPYTYNWSNNSTSKNQSNLAAGSYSVTITDANGCTKTQSFTISQPAAMNAAIAVSPVVTVTNGQPYTIYKGYGPQSVTLSATVNGGTAPYTYSWQGSGINGATTASVSVSPTSTTTYNVTITDSKGCSATVSRTITVINVSTGNNKVKICHNGNTISVSANAVSAHLNHGCKLGDCSIYGSNKQSNTNENEEEHGNNDDDAHNIDQLIVNEITVYPNPSSGSFTVQLPEGENNAQVMIMDAAGRMIAKQVMTENSRAFDLSNVAQGMYNIHVVVGTETYRARIVIQ